jgi:hypothetical protein
MLILINLDTHTIKIESAELTLTKMDQRDATAGSSLAGGLEALIEVLKSSAAVPPEVGPVGEASAAVPPEVDTVGEATTEDMVVGVTTAAIANALRDLIEVTPQWGARSEEAIAKHLTAAGFDIGDLALRLEQAEADDLISSYERRNGDVVYSLVG